MNRLRSALILAVSTAAGIGAWFQAGLHSRVVVRVHFGDVRTSGTQSLRSFIVSYQDRGNEDVFDIESSCTCAVVRIMPGGEQVGVVGDLHGDLIIDRNKLEPGVLPGIVVKIGGRIFNVFMPPN